MELTKADQKVLFIIKKKIIINVQKEKMIPFKKVFLDYRTQTKKKEYQVNYVKHVL